MAPFDAEPARAYWRDRSPPAHAAGGKVVLVADARRNDRRDRTTRSRPMPSKRHHAEISKVLVDPTFRRAGVARALMAEIERRAAPTAAGS